MKAQDPQSVVGLSESAVLRALSEILDPEIPVINIVERGLVRAVELSADEICVTITPTYSGCPALDSIKEAIQAKLHQLTGLSVKIILQNSPPWSSLWMEEQAREKLRQYGIAPPIRSSGEDNLVPMPSLHSLSLEGELAVPCPFCNSVKTELISQFGSTACKALYRCQSCVQPFEYFKPI